MKNTVKYLLLGSISIVFLSGCCGRLGTPHTYSNCNTSEVQRVNYVQPQVVQRVKYISTPTTRVIQTPCVAYGYNNQCIAW